MAYDYCGEINPKNAILHNYQHLAKSGQENLCLCGILKDNSGFLFGAACK